MCLLVFVFGLVIGAKANAATYCVKPDGGCSFANRANATVADAAACTAVSVATCTGAGSALSITGAAGAFAAGDTIYYSGKNSAGADTDYAYELTIGGSGSDSNNRITYQGISDSTGGLYPRITNVNASGYGGGFMVSGQDNFNLYGFRIEIANSSVASAFKARSSQTDNIHFKNLYINMANVTGDSYGIQFTVAGTGVLIQDSEIAGCKKNSITFTASGNANVELNNINATAGGTSEFSNFLNIAGLKMTDMTWTGPGSSSQSVLLSGVSGLVEIAGTNLISTNPFKIYNSALGDGSYVDDTVSTSMISDTMQVIGSSNFDITNQTCNDGGSCVNISNSASINIDTLTAIDASNGINVQDGSYNIDVARADIRNSSSKCFEVQSNGTHDIFFHDSICDGNGVEGVQNGGIVLHDNAYNIGLYRLILSNNVGYGIGAHNTTHGYAHNITMYKNGWLSGPSGTYDGDISIGIISANAVVGGVNWTLRNIVSYQGKPNVRLSLAGDASVSIDNSVLFPFNAATTTKVGGVDKTYAEFQGLGYNTSGLNGDPKFVSSTNFYLQTTSPAIDAGTNVSLTTDYEGNPIYGLPDIGAYEYQPTKEMGTDTIYKDADITLYGNEKFRNRASESGGAIDFNLTIPNSNKTDYLNVDVSAWENSSTYQKTWTESTTSNITNTVHTIGDLEANKYYNVTVDDGITHLTGANCDTVSSNFVCFSDAEGKIVFTYTGTYSTHEFNVEEGDNTGPTTTASPSGGEYTNAQTVTLTCSDDGVGCDKTYYTVDGTSPTTSSSEYATPISISATITLKFFSTDLNGESEIVKTEIYVFEDEENDGERNLNVNKVKATSSENSITITWKTDHNTKSIVRYGTDKNLKEKKKDNSKEKKHKVILGNLASDTQYYFRIKAEDGDDNEDRSKVHSIRTLAASNSNPNLNNVAVAKTVTPIYSGNAEPNVCSYTVQTGDSLWTIAQTVYGNGAAYPLIIEKNKEKYSNIASRLSVGQELTFNCGEATVEGVTDTKDDNGVDSPEINQPSSSDSKFRWWNPLSWF